MPRAIWKGAISFGLVTIPVDLMTAESRAAGIEFHMLDKNSMSRVRQKNVAQATGEEVAWDDIVKGYEYSSGNYIVLEPEELEAVSPKAAHTIDIVAVVCKDCIDPAYFIKPYYVVPQAIGRKPYALLREVLKRNDQIAIAHVVIRTRQYLAALFPRGDALVLDLLRYATELKITDDLDLPESDLTALGVSDREFELAEQLVGQLVEKNWDPGEYTDTYRNQLLELIKKRVEQGDRIVEQPAAAESTTGGTVVDIMELLRRSVEAAKTQRKDSPPAQESTHRRRPA